MRKVRTNLLHERREFLFGAEWDDEDFGGGDDGGEGEDLLGGG